MEAATACDAWKKCTLEMVNLISNASKPSLIKNYNELLLENIDLKKQNKMAIAALDSAISEKDNDVQKNGEARNELRKEVKFCETIEKHILNTIAAPDAAVSDKDMGISKNSEARNIADELREQENIVCENKPNRKESKYVVIRKDTFPIKKSTSNDSRENISENQSSSACIETKVQQVPDFVCSNCKKLQGTDNHLLPDLINLKRQLDQANECNRKLTLELNEKTEESDHLRDQIQSLDLAVKTLTEAINLQDEQLSEYGSLVASLRKSRSQIIEKMKEANARNNYNVMIMANIEQEVEQLRRQLDAYNELLTNQQNINLIDKASSTEQTDSEQPANQDLLKKKDNFIALLQDRLCEAIVDLKNKDSEIKNHANSVKELINNYEAEKKCLEDRLKTANVSAGKLEENRIKQQETMKQLMKLIEFLQGKLEKINKK